MEIPLADIDWVRARTPASTLAVFQRILGGVRKDVAARNSLRRPGDGFRLEAVDAGNECTVTRHDSSGSMYVRFVLSPSGIEARGGTVSIHAMVTLDSHGRCGLNVNGVLTEDWHFRQMALELLFFDPPVSSSPPQPVVPARIMPSISPNRRSPLERFDEERGSEERRYRQAAARSDRMLAYKNP